MPLDTRATMNDTNDECMQQNECQHGHAYEHNKGRVHRFVAAAPPVVPVVLLVAGSNTSRNGFTLPCGL